MVDIAHYKVIRKHDIEGASLIAFIFKSDGGGFFSAVRGPSDVQLDVGDTIQHFVGDIWRDVKGNQLRIERTLHCSTFEEAERKFEEMIYC